MSTKAASATAVATAASLHTKNNNKKSSSISRSTMAISKITKPVKKQSQSQELETSSNGKTHKRSRSGCFTCRLRRKKCDEGKPGCKACRGLGLTCEYKRPSWWNDNHLRRAQKELIKTLIKKTKTVEKQQSKESSTAPGSGLHSPPALSRSVPTSATSPGSIGRTRAISEDSQFSDYDAQAPFYQADPYNTQFVPQYYETEQHYYGAPQWGPYEVDVKTERQIFVDNVPTRRDSTMSSFTTYGAPHTSLPPLLEQDWIAEPEQIYQDAEDMFSEYPPIGYPPVEFPETVEETTAQVIINVDLEDEDKHLLEHFFHHVVPLIFPVMASRDNGSAVYNMIIDALKSNKTYLSSCLTTAALHLRSTTEGPSQELDNDIIKHRYATIAQLCSALELDTEHDQILEATLAMITMPCTTGRLDDNNLHDIPWHKHFEAATSLIVKLDLPSRLLDAGTPHTSITVPFNMTIAAWIDILGSTMLGTAPKFADVYRNKHLASSMAGLAEVMGCDDKIMYLISELACLGAMCDDERLSEEALCQHITELGKHIDIHEAGLIASYEPSMDAAGNILPRALQKNITLLFSKALRIYLCSLIPGITRHNPTMQNLLVEFVNLMELIPSGPGGFDRSIVWPLLVAGAHSTSDSPFRAAFAERVTLLAEHGETGSFSKMTRLLQEVWSSNDVVDALVEAASGTTDPSLLAQQSLSPQQDVHWRDVMRAKGWDFLLL